MTLWLNENTPQPSSSGQGEPGEPPLVDQLAELRMIRSMQVRVNDRTKQFTELAKTEEAEQPELIEALQKLAERESRIHRITRDIASGRNQ